MSWTRHYVRAPCASRPLAGRHCVLSTGKVAPRYRGAPELSVDIYITAVRHVLGLLEPSEARHQGTDFPVPEVCQRPSSVLYSKTRRTCVTLTCCTPVLHIKACARARVCQSRVNECRVHITLRPEPETSPSSPRFVQAAEQHHRGAARSSPPRSSPSSPRAARQRLHDSHVCVAASCWGATGQPRHLLPPVERERGPRLGGARLDDESCPLRESFSLSPSHFFVYQ